MALALARVLTGFDARAARRTLSARPSPSPGADVLGRPRARARAAASHARSPLARDRGRPGRGRGHRSSSPWSRPSDGGRAAPRPRPRRRARTSCSSALGVALLVVLDIAIRAARAQRELPAVARGDGRACAASAGRAAGAWRSARALLGFYVTLHGLPQPQGRRPARCGPTTLFDRQLADSTARCSRGHDPATLLHTLLGTGISTQVLSTFYVAFIVFLPLSLGVALVFSRDLRARLFYATAHVDQLAARRRRATSCCRRSGPPTSTRRSSPRCRTPRSPTCRRVLLDQRVGVPAQPGDGDAAGDRGVRVAAHLDELHRGARPRTCSGSAGG